MKNYQCGTCESIFTRKLDIDYCPVCKYYDLEEYQDLSNQSDISLLKEAFEAGNNSASMPESDWETVKEDFIKWMRDNSAKEKKFTIIEILHELDECDHIDDARSYFLNYNPN